MLLVGWWCHGFTICHQYMLKLLDVVDVGLGQFSIDQVVHTMNFKNPQQIMASRTINGVWGLINFISNQFRNFSTRLMLHMLK